MPQNLLNNPGFEGITTPGGWTRATHYGIEFGEIYTPEGWVAWWEENKYRRPEMKVVPKQAPFLDPPRIKSGNWALQAFTFCGRQHAGYYQTVTGLIPGKTYEFNAYAHAWSTTTGLQGADDAKCSAGVGCGPKYLTDADVPALNGNPENDAIGNFTFQVGISFGSPEPFYGVTWGERAHIYNGYFKVPPVRFVAPSNGQVVVYLRAESLWEFRTSDAYWDDAELVLIDEIPPENPPRGEPRTQYARTYILLPPNANKDWALAIIDATWNDKRYTFGGSADDAGIGNLDNRRVIAINPQKWNGNLAEFFAQYYPGVKYESIVVESPDQLRLVLKTQSILLWQKDSPWRDVHYAGGLCDTIGNKGCWITDCAMAQRYFGIKPDATPLTVDATIGKEGYTNCLMLWDAMKQRLGLEVIKSTTSVTEAKAHLDGGGVCFAEVLPTSLLHFVLVTKYSGNRYWMFDPLRPAEGWLDEYYQGVESWRLVRKTQPQQEFTLRGVHDIAGADWLAANNLKGWCVESVDLNLTPRKIDNLEYLRDKGVRVILRLNYSYATRDYGMGTMPDPTQLQAFENAVIETMRLNPAAWGFLYCNEMNSSDEWPNGFNLTPNYYVESYNRIWANKPMGARFAPGAIDPYRGDWGDWRQTWKICLQQFTNADFLALHAYTHHYDLNEILSTKQFGDAPLIGVYYDLRVLETQQAIIPQRFANLPQVVTETNHFTKLDSSIGWEPTAGDWVKEAYKYFASRGVAAACLFRFNYNDWRFNDKQEILEALKGI